MNQLIDFKTIKKYVESAVMFAAIIGSALMFWNIAKLITHTESPIVVVLTGSMEPAFQRGDLLLVTHFPEDLKMGDIIVFKSKGQIIPIVHRALVLQVHVNQKPNQPSIQVKLLDQVTEYLTQNPIKESFLMLSKGDANPVNDRGLYPPGQLWLSREELIGKIRGYCPYIGYMTIMLNENPPIKYTVLGLMFLSQFLAKDQKET